jgi:hypothetical protein
MKLVGELFGGGVDIIGDIHGEYGALCTLLDRLGYDYNGMHPEGRRLVFVGDLVDRGPDSVSVVRLVKRFIEKGVAQCIIGNHEFNLLRKQHKHGNGWFYGDVETIRKDKKASSYSTLVESDEQRKEIIDFISSLPVALIREDLRIVHAAWHPESIEKLKILEGHTILEAFKIFEAQIEAKIVDENVSDEEEKELMHQNLNPIKVITSGLEQKAKERYYAGGKWRTIERNNWWENYQEETRVVFGHYWRRTGFGSGSDPLKEIVTVADPFVDAAAWHDFVGKKNRCFCVDYSVGLRYEERGHFLHTGSAGTALAALRIPELKIVTDVGHAVEVQPSLGLESKIQ